MSELRSMSSYEKWSLFISIIGIVVVFYIGWLQYSISKSLQHLQPDLRGTIDKVYDGSLNPTDSGAILEVTIGNLGSPSVVRGYNLVLRLAGSTSTTDYASTLLPKNITSSDGKIIATFDSTTDAIYEKTVQPIGTGAEVVGWIFFKIPNVTGDQLHASGTSMNLDFQDITGKEYQTHTWLFDGTAAKEQYYVPGGGRPFVNF